MNLIKSIIGRMHDTGAAPGCLPYKIVVMVELPMTEFKKLCPKDDLSNLVYRVNSEVYEFNNAIPAYHPSIDSQGSRRAKNGIKTLEFVYFMDKSMHERAQSLGFKVTKLRNGDFYPNYYQCVKIQAQGGAR
jgi:hypothetical protein